MKALRLLVSLFLVSTAALSAAPDDSSVKVEAGRSLSLAIVDLDRNNAASEPLHAAFKESLGFEMSQRIKAATPIKSARVDGSRAGWGLGTGTYDVAIVIGGNLPKTMVSSAFTILKAVPRSGDARRTLTLVTRNEDPGLARLLAESFPEALKSPAFQKELFRYSGALDTKDTEWKVAGLGN